MTKRLISVIVPAFNEEENVERAYAAIVAEFQKTDDLEYELIFTDNHSTDGTFQKLETLAARDPRVKVLRFARNFGFNLSILTGYRYARGEAAIQIDCDLEDPPAMIHDFVRLWRAGHDVVVGIRARRPEPLHMVMARRFYYWILDRTSDVHHQIDAGDFRLVDRRILSQLHEITDAQPYVRGLISELASNQTGIRYTRASREFGESKFPLSQLTRLAFDGVFAYSIVPLRLATYLGVLVAVVTAALMVFYGAGRLFFGHNWPAGFATTTILLLTILSLNSIFLGIIGEYVARIYNQVRTRPAVVIERTLNVEESREQPPVRGGARGLQ